MGCIPASAARPRALGGGLILLAALGAALGAACLPQSAAAASDPGGSLCLAAEKPLFACPVGRKLVSVCGGDHEATYRYGRPAHVELSSEKLGLAKQAFSGGGETQISFTNAGVTYVVFDKTVRTSFSPGGGNDPDFTSGLAVLKNGHTVATMACSSDATISSDAARYMPAKAFVPH